MERSNIRDILASNAPFEVKFIPDLEHLKEVVKTLQKSGYKVVLVQGVYDLYHVNHGKYLSLARQQGDVLIVGVDSDELTRKCKGKNRPIDPEAERLEGLSFLSSVSILTLRTLQEAEKDMHYLCKAIHPDVLVMSRSTGKFPERRKDEFEKLGMRVEILDPQGATSTSLRVRKMNKEGAEELQRRIQKVVDDYFAELRGESK